MSSEYGSAVSFQSVNLYKSTWQVNGLFLILICIYIYIHLLILLRIDGESLVMIPKSDERVAMLFNINTEPETLYHIQLNDKSVG